jgi:Fur family iron response transcriptional regulator
LRKIIEKDSRKKISLATLYNTVHAFKKRGYLKEISLKGNKTFFDTNTKNHHHFYDEDSSQLIDIKKENFLINNLPSAPSGKKIKDIEIVIRVASNNQTQKNY